MRAVVAPAMQFAQQLEALADRSEFDVEFFGQLHHRVEAAVGILELEQRVVEHREEAAAQHGEDAELIVRPLDGAQGGAQRAHFFAAVERFRAHQQVRDAARFQAAHIFLRQVGAEIGEAAEENADVLRAHADPGSGRRGRAPSSRSRCRATG